MIFVGCYSDCLKLPILLLPPSEYWEQAHGTKSTHFKYNYVYMKKPI